MDFDDLVCNCMGITKSEIVEAIKTKGLVTLEEIREETDAGTGCGSCIENIEDILKEING